MFVHCFAEASNDTLRFVTKTKPAKKAPHSSAKEPQAAPTKKRKSAPARRLPENFVHIGITPPNLAKDTDAQRLDELLSDREGRPSTIVLSQLPWLKQRTSYRAGHHMMTHGLREHANHPEVEVCNVPGVLVRPIAQILNEIADYVLNSGRQLKPGQTMSLTPVDDPFLGVLSFRRIQPGKGGSDHTEDVFRVIFLR